MAHRHVNPTDQQELPLRMLYQPAGGGSFLRACEADSFRGLVAALLGDSGYEQADTETRLVARLRLAHDVRLLAEVGGRQLDIGDRDAADTINVASDDPLIRSLDRIGFVSVDPGLNEARNG